MRSVKLQVVLLVMLMGPGLGTAPWALAQEKPRYGGVLRVAHAADPPSLDTHQEQTFAVQIPLAPVYNTLVMFDPHNYPKVIGDLAAAWTVAADGMLYTFTLHHGVKFHDGSDLTSADVKASWDKIVFPPEGVISVRKSYYQMIKSIVAPDRDTVVFQLRYPSASFMNMLAHPANFIYAKKYLDEDMQYYKKHAMGSGPFKLKSYIHGASLEVERNPNYWKKGLPYLDGVKYFIITDDSARAKALRAGRTEWNFVSSAPAKPKASRSSWGIVSWSPMRGNRAISA